MEESNGQYHVLVIIADGQVHGNMFYPMLLFILIQGSLLSFPLCPEILHRFPEVLIHHPEGSVHKNKQL